MYAAAFCRTTTTLHSCKKCVTGITCAADVPKECCAQAIAAGISDTVRNDRAVSCRTHGPPCVMPLQPKDLCTPNPCMAGASCAVEYASDYDICKQQVVCACPTGYIGQFCEIKCPTGSTTCGAQIVGKFHNSYIALAHICKQLVSFANA
jgi:hypothetical protein